MRALLVSVRFETALQSDSVAVAKLASASTFDAGDWLQERRLQSGSQLLEMWSGFLASLDRQGRSRS